MKIADTLSGHTTELREGPVRIYLCGVTTYDDTHIGHARTIIVFDVLRRFLAKSGRDVTLVQNCTDIDDKIIARAEAEGTDPLQLSERYISRYHEDFDRLRVVRAHAYPRATAHIRHITDMVSSLVESGHAYVAESGVYYSVESFPQYGKLSGKHTHEMLTGVRIDVQEDKRSPLDFALWKRARTGPLWESPWGPGRPGWHIECSAMSLDRLGEDFEIHGGGRDLIFPHHENEIAQSEGHTGRRQARIWMHTGMVTISGQKMSKSLGNIVSTRVLLDRWGPNVLRLFCLSGHYSKPIDYSPELLAEAVALWRRMEACRHTLEQTARGAQAGAVPDAILGHAQKFDGAMSSDLNTHEAVSALTDMAKTVGEMAAGGTLDREGAAAVQCVMDRMMDALGLYVAEPPPGLAIPDHIQKRRRLRQEGLYEEADAIRDMLRGKSVELLDYRGGTVWVYREDIPGETNA